MENYKSWRHYCVQKILKRMRGDRFGALFANPVLEASDSVIPPAVKESYRLIIPKPMDYSTVKSNIEKGIYQSPEEFHEDMLLIYDNCMKFNPSTGPNSWIHNAAVSNKDKYLKSWESSKGKLAKLLAKEDKGTPETVKKTTSVDIEDSKIEFNNGSSFDSDISAATSSHVVEAPQPAPTPPPPPVPTFSFRISLEKIREYKSQLSLQSTITAQKVQADASPPVPTEVPQIATQESDDILVKDNEDPEPNEKQPIQVVPITDPILHEERNKLPFLEQEEEAETVVDSELNVPPIASRREENILRVNWLSENECNKLFPHCSIIGLDQSRLNYNASDISLRCIYNELYLSEKACRKDVSKRDCQDATLKEDYTMKQHKMISFLLGKPKYYNKPTQFQLQEFVDTDTVSVTDEDISPPSSMDPESSYSPSSGNTTLPNSTDCSQQSTPVRVQTLHIKLRTEATINVGCEAERVLLKNGFTRARSKNCKVKCSHELSFTSEFNGYYKADESVFMYRNCLMRHLRLFLVSCGAVEVELSRRSLHLADLLLNNGTGNEVYDLFLESKKRHPRNIAFFQLPNSGKASYSRSMDVIWRLQTVSNALPTPFLVLHVVFRDI